jgi:hypothetical protein
VDEAAVDIGAWCSWLEKEETYLMDEKERTVLVCIRVRHLGLGVSSAGFGVDISMSGDVVS